MISSSMLYDFLVPHTILNIDGVCLEKIRLGNKNGDGGYIFPKNINIEALLSYGVGNDISFEIDFTNTFNKQSYCFDHTIETPPPLIDNVFYFKEGVASNKTNDCDTISSHIERLMLLNKHIAIKMDIEGHEYNVIKDMSLTNIDVIVIEMHAIHSFEYNTCIINNDVFERLHEHYICFHIHGNNYCGVNYNGVPNVIELTLINKSIIKSFAKDIGCFPTPLDAPNNINNSDYPLSWWK